MIHAPIKYLKQKVIIYITVEIFYINSMPYEQAKYPHTRWQMILKN